MKHKKLIGIFATSAILLGSVAAFAACGGQKHTVERVDETQATCTEGGHAAYYKCADDGCGKLFSDIEGKHEIKWDDVEKTDPLGHSMTRVDAKDATCTENGANEHYHCERCELNFADEAGSAEKTDAVLDALGHDMKPVDKVLPVTGQPGILAHYRCERENNQEYFDSFGDKKVTDENRHELEYNMLTAAPSGWYDVHHDFSHSNDADPYVTITGENGLNVATSEYYTDIAYTARVRKSNVNRQFIVLFFENKGIYSISVDDGKINCDSEMSGWDYKTEQGYNYLNDEWNGYTLSKGEQDSYEGNGLEVTLARTGKTVKVLVNGREVHSATLADEYETQPAKGGMLVWNAVPGVKYYFRAEQQAESPAAPKVTVAPVDEEQGAVTLNQETFAYGDELVITVTPTDDYVLDTLFVNGRDVTALVEDGAYTTTATNDVQITATFVTKEFGSLNASVTGKKHGSATSSVAENASFELVGKNKTYAGTLTGGKLVLDKVIVGEYTLKIENHIDFKVTVEKDTAYEAAIALEYDLLTVNKTNNIGADKVDLTHQNDAESYINVTGGDGHLNVTANERYGDVMVTAIFKRENVWNQRMGFLLAFSDKEGVQLGFDTFDDSENVTLHFWYDGEHHPGYACVRDYYNFKQDSFARLNGKFDLMGCAPLTAEWLEKFNGDGLEVSLVRKGNKILALVEGVAVGMVEVDSNYADDTVQLGFFAEWVNPMQIPFEITTTLPEFTAPTFTLTQGQNGTVTKTSGDTYSVWEKITLEITPDFNYRLKQLTVNGFVITGNKTEYSFYPVAGENTVVAEFEQIPYGSVNAEIVGKKHGVTGNAIADGTKVTLIGTDNVKYEVSIENGKIAVEEAVAGTYTVKIDGYLDSSITVAEGMAYNTAIALEYEMFTTFGWYDAHQDFSHQNDAEAYVTIKDSDGLNFVTKNAYDQVAITVTVGKDVCAGERTGVMMTFDNKMLWLTVKKTDTVILEWLGDGNWDNPTIVPNVWSFEGNALTEEDLVTWNNNTMTVTLVRDGKNFHAFVNGTHRTSLSVNGYETQQTKAGVRAWGAVIGRQYHVQVEENISSYLAATVTLNTPEHGSVIASKTENVHLSDEITLDITPDSGYRIKSVTVNGTVLQANNGVYRFNAVKENEVVVEFELITYGSLDATLTGRKHGVSGNAIENGTEIKLVGPKEYTVTVADGKLALAQIETGTYTVKLAGYFDGTITIAADTKYETAIALEYNFMKGTGWYDDQQDLSHVNDADAYVTLKGSAADDKIHVSTVNEYDSIAITVTFGKDMRGNNNLVGPALIYGDKFLTVTVQADNKTFEICGYGSYWGMGNIAPEEWKFEKMTDEEWAAYENNTLALTLVKSGNTAYLFVGDTLRMTKEVGTDQKARAGIMGDNTVKQIDGNPVEWHFKVEEDISAYLAKLPTE